MFAHEELAFVDLDADRLLVSLFLVSTGFILQLVSVFAGSCRCEAVLRVLRDTGCLAEHVAS